MRGNTILSITTFIAASLPLAAFAADLSGRTADGCSYKVINGQYMTTCPKKGTVAAEPVHAVSAGPVTSYGDVPVRRNTSVSAPALPPQQPNQAIFYAPAGGVSAIEREESVAALDERDEIRRSRLKNKLLDQTYAGLSIGASNVKEANTGSTTGFGLDIGTNIDETFGVEIGYSYAKQSLNLGLASRGASTDPSQSSTTGFGAVPPSSDSALSTHLFTGEIQAHLTDPVKRLRPYLGAGLGWRSATLAENASAGAATYGQSLAGGSLHQNSFGGLAAAGTKLRITKALNLGFAFRYFFPIARQDARLEQPVAVYSAQAPAQSKLSAADDGLTGSSQYQVLGGVQYSF